MNKVIFLLVALLLAGFFLYRSWNNGKIAEQNLTLGQAFLLKNGQKNEVTTTESGLQYQVLQVGTGEKHPTANSHVTVHYEGKLLDGSIFDSSIERDQPITFSLNQVIKGWQEGVQLMVEGEKMRFFIPSHLAYGKNGTGPIPPAATLIFDVELLEIQ
ncbi:FKBP-type peptidyl-prolyl cis-trans isomerase [Vibrio cincinnatiensis]|jgi:peptidylprolyl isomerase|uniref:Peptidyl-prolyl cis-trans isomerase n=1 Tax=Vibrio cincinnatiensis DSM 19608 TaxID=1123491 RepID=A0A1T4S6I2_VIBCI|nr:FKBP-type peptidyl-prolyl cis-trans isomerase [Vibrio cincinnatiensis]MCG3724069.1 FKBP-type peptidyl-prolyl cis-trans isomerase [Vibrio cincinnatiensis]MCG3726283.1 FKBP-type peptidyl-prolyl cis-trans isomerase [Vibrio cincinnatiensis]MCG3733416.1 FKBP-type peptidyl-prolyl cis-trans isomerase [Vibrio cincinnatiensis]MCG3737115.1 FKBP-type peptidyl-prolyl cis-trans isomerase [Vibrio cincinnatiensis]MCG3740791.1 FKBP-type peptidyl-prolyl cis-trans isomerase [Vibrio cincinnatiensis]